MEVIQYVWWKWLFSQADDELLSKLKAHDRLSSENVDLMTKVKFLQLDKDKLQTEVDKVRAENSFLGRSVVLLSIAVFLYICNDTTIKINKYIIQW